MLLSLLLLKRMLEPVEAAAAAGLPRRNSLGDLKNLTVISQTQVGLRRVFLGGGWRVCLQCRNVSFFPFLSSDLTFSLIGFVGFKPRITPSSWKFKHYLILIFNMFNHRLKNRLLLLFYKLALWISSPNSNQVPRQVLIRIRKGRKWSYWLTITRAPWSRVEHRLIGDTTLSFDWAIAPNR